MHAFFQALDRFLPAPEPGEPATPAGGRVLLAISLAVGLFALFSLAIGLGDPSPSDASLLWTGLAVVGFVVPEAVRRSQSVGLGVTLLFTTIGSSLIFTIHEVPSADGLLAYHAIVLLPLLAAAIGGARSAWHTAVSLIMVASAIHLLGNGAHLLIPRVDLAPVTWILCALASITTLTALAALAEHTATAAATQRQSHAVRNPLTAVKSNVDLALHLLQQDPNADPTVIEALRDARRSAVQIARLTESPEFRERRALPVARAPRGRADSGAFYLG